MSFIKQIPWLLKNFLGLIVWSLCFAFIYEVMAGALYQSGHLQESISLARPISAFIMEDLGNVADSIEAFSNL